MVSKASELLPEPESPVTTVSVFLRNADVDVLQIMLPCAADRDVGMDMIWGNRGRRVT